VRAPRPFCAHKAGDAGGARRVRHGSALISAAAAGGEDGWGEQDCGGAGCGDDIELGDDACGVWAGLLAPDCVVAWAEQVEAGGEVGEDIATDSERVGKDEAGEARALLCVGVEVEDIAEGEPEECGAVAAAVEVG